MQLGTDAGAQARAAQQSRLAKLRPLDGGLPTESAGLLGVLPITAPSSVQRVVGAPSGRSAAVVFADGSAQVHPLPG